MFSTIFLPTLRLTSLSKMVYTVNSVTLLFVSITIRLHGKLEKRVKKTRDSEEADLMSFCSISET